MTRLHLPAIVPNEGARRLAWVILDRHRGDMAAFADTARLPEAVLDRLLVGEIVPGTDIALPIGVATDGFILRRDWQVGPDGGWFDRPSARPSLAGMH